MKITTINKEQMFKIIMNTGSHDINSSYRDNYFEVQPDINKCTFDAGNGDITSAVMRYHGVEMYNGEVLEWEGDDTDITTTVSIIEAFGDYYLKVEQGGLSLSLYIKKDLLR